MSASLRSALITALSALLALAALDLALQQVSPIDRKREAADGLAQLKRSDPETLVIGSSHARTFHVLGEHLASLTGKPTPLVAVPLENGKLVPYEWLLFNRIAPILDERNRDGTEARTNLKRFVLLTEWWDSCRQSDGVHWNLPSRAWGFRHFVEHVAENGLDSYARNYPQYKFRQLLSFSALARDRSEPKIRDTLVRLLAGKPLERTQDEYRAYMADWHRGVEGGVDCIRAPEHMAALERILDFAAARNLDTTIILFPRMPGTLTDRAKQTTLAAFREAIESLAAPRRVRVIDLTWQTPLQDDDFMADFDHVNAKGNLKFARWALQNDLSFLLEPTPVPVAAEGREIQKVQ